MSTALVPEREHKPGEPYDEPIVLAALLELALAGGSPTRAARRLKERGTPVSRQVLQKWLDTRAEQYAQIRDEQARAIQARIAVEHEDLAIQAAGVTRKLLARLDEEASDIPIRDVAGAARNAGTIAGISTDKQMLTRERPLPLSQPPRAVAELERSLVSLGVAVIVEPGTLAHVEVPDAEVVEENSG